MARKGALRLSWLGENKAKQFSRSLVFALDIIFFETPYFEQENWIAFVFARQTPTQSSLDLRMYASWQDATLLCCNVANKCVWRSLRGTQTQGVCVCVLAGARRCIRRARRDTCSLLSTSSATVPTCTGCVLAASATNPDVTALQTCLVLPLPHLSFTVCVHPSHVWADAMGDISIS